MSNYGNGMVVGKYIMSCHDLSSLYLIDKILHQFSTCLKKTSQQQYGMIVDDNSHCIILLTFKVNLS